jgi:hypothetical protein
MYTAGPLALQSKGTLKKLHKYLLLLYLFQVRWTRDPTPGSQRKGSRKQHARHNMTGLDIRTTEEDQESRPGISAALEEGP